MRTPISFKIVITQFFKKSNKRFEYCLDINLALDIYEHIYETKERQLVIESIK